MRQLVELGKVGRPHGFKGDFVVQSHGGRDSALAYLDEVFVGPSDQSSECPLESFKILEASWMPKGWKVSLDGVNSIEKVRSWQEYSVLRSGNN